MKFYKLTIVFLVFLISSGFVHLETSHKGIVKDAETGKPLNDVVVLLGLDYTCYLPPNPAGPNSQHLAIEESYTNNKGVFRLPLNIYTLPPLLCFTERNIKYFKPGYFPFSENDTSGTVELYKMNHFLNFLPYKNPNRPHYIFNFEEKSQYYKDALDKMMKTKLNPIDNKGVFLRANDTKLTQLYSIKNDAYKYPHQDTFYVYDEASSGWMFFNGRGNIIEPEPSNLPNWDFVSSEKGWPLYANKNSIFFPIEKNPRPAGMKYKKNEIKYITPMEGNISALVGSVMGNFFTIEDNGKSLCRYGGYISKESAANNFTPRFIQSFQGKDIPFSGVDDTLDETEFKYIVETRNHGFYVVTKTPKYWHIYSFGQQYKKEMGFINIIISFPVEKHITAFTGEGNGLYIAFKNEGIRKYEFGQQYNGKRKIKEDPSFFYNTKEAAYSDVSSLVLGSAVNNLAIYATTGDDKIYRFSLDGTPDYKVYLEE